MTTCSKSGTIRATAVRRNLAAVLVLNIVPAPRWSTSRPLEMRIMGRRPRNHLPIRKVPGRVGDLRRPIIPKNGNGGQDLLLPVRVVLTMHQKGELKQVWLLKRGVVISRMNFNFRGSSSVTKYRSKYRKKRRSSSSSSEAEKVVVTQPKEPPPPPVKRYYGRKRCSSDEDKLTSADESAE